MTIDAAGCLGCLSMHKLSLDAPTHFYQCSWWPSLQLDVLDVYRCTSCALMHQHIFMDAQDDPGCSRMVKMTLNAAECLGCLSTHKFCLDAPRDLYGCSRWPSMQLDVLDVYWCTSCALLHQHIFMDAQDDPRCSWMLKMALDAAWCTWVHLDVLGCSLMHLLAAWCTWMQLDVLDVNQCTSCVLMHQHIFIDF